MATNDDNQILLGESDDLKQAAYSLRDCSALALVDGDTATSELLNQQAQALEASGMEKRSQYDAARSSAAEE